MLDRDGGLSGPLKIATSFHPDGKLAPAFLAEDATIAGVPCEASLFVPTRFDADGNLVGCLLTREAVIAGERFPACSTIAIAADGRARRVER